MPTETTRTFVCQGCGKAAVALYGAAVKCGCGTTSAAQIDAPLTTTELDHRLFAKRAAILASKAAHWASSALALPEDNGQPFPIEAAERFASEMRWIIDIIVRDAKANG